MTTRAEFPPCEPLPSSKKEARAIGAKYYFSGMPCKYGHIAKRLVSNNSCVICQSDRQKKWKAANPDRAKQLVSDWALNNPERVREKSRKYYRKNAEARRAYSKEYRKANPEKIKADLAAWRSENIETERAKSRARTRLWIAENPERHSANRQTRRARILGADGSHQAADIKRIHQAQKGKCAVCKKHLNGKWHVDHIVPLARGGSNWPSNLQLLCEPCNRSKSDRDPIDFMRSKGMLL